VLLALDHVAIAVHDLDAAIERFRRLYGAEVAHRATVEAQGVEEAMIPVGESTVQLLSPLGPDTPVGRFLAKQGEGLHHLAFVVSDIEAAMARLEAEGAELIDKQPRLGSGGRRIAFIHPRTFGSSLTELVEAG
jgi:methylmalonyl-CoA/ethylmalonyl-CoA epimerase